MNVKARLTRGERHTEYGPWWLENYEPVMPLHEVGKRMGGMSRGAVKTLERRVIDQFVVAFTGATVEEIEYQVQYGHTINGRSMAGVMMDELLLDALGVA